MADGANMHESGRFENVVSEFDRVSAERASNPGYVSRQWPFCPSVEDCGRPEQDNFIDSYGRRRTSGNPNSLVHFHTGQKHAVSGRRSQGVRRRWLRHAQGDRIAALPDSECPVLVEMLKAVGHANSAVLS